MADNYLSMSIASYGSCTIDPPAKQPFVIKNTNDTSDVEGARFVSKYGRFSNKPDLRENNDIFGSTSKRLHNTRNVQDNTLRVNDIDGAHAKIRNRMLLTERHIDPLMPAYSLPNFAVADPHEPKFIKDTLNVNDIDGTSCRKKKEYAVRDVLGVSDIVGAQACWRPRNAEARLKAESHAIMEVNDISHRTHRYIDHTDRSTNSLDPQYMIYGENIKDDQRYTKPRKAKAVIPDGHLLQTRDIAGAYQGWEPSGLVRREYKVTNVINDIQGAQADTIKHSITTKRETHPLNPVYQSLDGYGQQLPNPVQPLVPAPLVKNATIRPGSSGIAAVAASAPKPPCGPLNSSRLSNPPTSRRERGNDEGGIFGGKSMAAATPRTADGEPLQATSPRSQMSKPPMKPNTMMDGMLSNRSGGILTHRSGGSAMMSARSGYNPVSGRGQESAREHTTSYPETAESYGNKFIDTDIGGNEEYGTSISTMSKSGRERPPMPVLPIKQRASPRVSGPNAAERRAMSDREEEIRSVRAL